MNVFTFIVLCICSAAFEENLLCLYMSQTHISVQKRVNRNKHSRKNHHLVVHVYSCEQKISGRNFSPILRVKIMAILEIHVFNDGH